MRAFLRVTEITRTERDFLSGEISVTHALAPAEIHCIVRALRCADEWHTAAAPRRRWLGWPAVAPIGCGFTGREAHPLQQMHVTTAARINQLEAWNGFLPRAGGVSLT
jgi:hypothetical protein